MRTKANVLSVVALALTFTAVQPAYATLCYRDSNDDGTGDPIKWVVPETGIPVYVNDVLLDPGFKAAAAAAIEAAFLAYEQIPCSTLTFDFQGASSSTATSSVDGAILVAFSDNSGMGSGAYYHSLETTVASAGENIGWASIKLNTESNQGYTVGAEPNKIDIQTAVMQMIAPIIGFYAGTGDPNEGNFPDEIKYNYQNIELSEEQIQGVQAVYFEDDGSGCTQPTMETSCLSLEPQPDQGVAGDGFTPISDQGVLPQQDNGVNPIADQGIAIGDGGNTNNGGDDDDDGCCRVSHARRVPLSSAFLALLGVLFVLASRRRR